MKKTLALVVVLFLTTTLFAQTGVTRFLGIPVDGTKTEMIQKLKSKGFTSIPGNPEVLEGEFNGKNVHIFVVTNNNKVYRIMVADAKHTNETNIKINFNNLCQQFLNNEKYMPAASPSDIFIPENENIEYEMLVKKKRYEAIFYQFPDYDSITEFVKSKYPDEVFMNPTEEQKAEIKKTSEQYIQNTVFKNPVWFMINENYGEYYITLYYDNENNKANGEDL